MKFNRLEHFKKNSEKVKRYRSALAVLYDLGIDQMLLELSHDVEADIYSTDKLTTSALNYQRVLGFKDCLRSLFTLEDIEIPPEQLGSPDYGAVERMVKEGLLKEEDVDAFLKGEIE